MSEMNQDQTTDPMPILTKDFSEAVQKELLQIVTRQPQENAMSLMSQDFLRKMQEEAAKGVTLEEVKSKRIRHGKLVGCSYSASSNGMMYNSNTLLHISVTLTDGVQRISYTEKQAFQPTKTTVYQPVQDALAAVQDLAERENLAAWSALEYHDPFQCTDYSGSASISLHFDDRSAGGDSSTCVSINVSAACQHGGGAVIQQFRDILEAAVQDAEVLSETTSEAPAFGTGMMGMLCTPPAPAAPVPEPKRPDGAWRCKTCGCDSNTGRFCTECGSKWEPPLPPSPERT